MNGRPAPPESDGKIGILRTGQTLVEEANPGKEVPPKNGAARRFQKRRFHDWPLREARRSDIEPPPNGLWRPGQPGIQALEELGLISEVINQTADA